MAHPGNYKGLTIEQRIFNFLQGVTEAAGGLKFEKFMLLIENTAGAGAQLGRRLEEPHVMREYGSKMTDLPIGFCLDTCHPVGGGLRHRAAAGLKETLGEVERLLGIENVHVIHANDSKSPLGSHVDRHQNIGEGYIGLEGFRRISQPPETSGQSIYSRDAGRRRRR